MRNFRLNQLELVVMSTLREYSLYAVDKVGLPVELGQTASFTEWGATNVAIHKLKRMTTLNRNWKGLTKTSPCFAVERLIG
jgi:hypothetical protein